MATPTSVPRDRNTDILQVNQTVYDFISGNITNDSQYGDEYYADREHMYRTFGYRCIAFTIFSVICIGFNILSLICITRIRGNRSVHHTLLLNLACCDILGSILLYIYYNSPILFPLFDMQHFGHCLFLVLCLVFPFILSLSSSSLSLLTLALNQYLAICDPLFSATKITKRSASIVITIMWAISTTAAILPAILLFARVGTEKCDQYIQELAIKSIEICSYCLVAFIIVIVGLYARIYREIVLFRKRTPQLRNATCIRARRSDETEHNYKAFMTTLLLTGTLLIFWLPFLCLHFITSIVTIDRIPESVLNVKFIIIDFLPMCTYITNPIIYGIRMREIRDAYQRLFAKILPCCVKEPRPANIRGSVRFSTIDSTTVL